MPVRALGRRIIHAVGPIGGVGRSQSLIGYHPLSSPTDCWSPVAGATTFCTTRSA